MSQSLPGGQQRLLLAEPIQTAQQWPATLVPKRRSDVPRRAAAIRSGRLISPGNPTRKKRDQAEERGNEGDAGDGATRVMPCRILLVEDDAMIGPLLAETLAGLGYEVCGIEATEAGAVAAAVRYRPDLMIVDVNLASGTGTAAMERITRAGPVPHLFMSGYTRQAAMPGAVLLTKPFREADLVQAIGRALAPTALPA